MQFSTGNRSMTSRTRENDAFASKNVPEVTQCVGSVNFVLCYPGRLRWKPSRASTRLCTFLVAKLGNKILVTKFTYKISEMDFSKMIPDVNTMSLRPLWDPKRLWGHFKAPPTPIELQTSQGISGGHFWKENEFLAKS